jgi:putative endopeptidase
LFWLLVVPSPVFCQENEMDTRANLPDGASGVDLTGRDIAVRPGDNFFLYANGTYLEHLIIPPDRSGYSTGLALTDVAQQRVHKLLQDESSQAKSGSPEQLVGDYYAAYMDEARIERLGISPLSPALQLIRRADSRQKLAALMGRENADFFGSIFHLDISPDIMNPTRNVVQISQPTLGLPDRSYYLDSALSSQRRDYQAYIAQLLSFAGWPQSDDAAAQIAHFETRIAEVSWDPEQERDPAKRYNPVTLSQLAGLAPGFPWSDFLAAAGVNREAQFNVVEKSAVLQIAALYQKTPLSLLQAWAMFALLDHAAPYLSKAFADAAFDLHGKSLEGRKQPPERWRQATRLVSSANSMSHMEEIANIGDAVGQLYVAHYFAPAKREQVKAVVGNIMTALRRRIESLTWMEPASKAEALRKLQSYNIQIGYPDRWRSYEGLHILPNDLVGNIERAAAFNWRFRLTQLRHPVDRDAWLMEPQTVNAYNDGPLRQIVFSAAVLEPPVFDAAADAAVNYGGIGAIIGHELTHGFDDQGRRFDSLGRVRDWWAAGDSKNFLAKAANLGAQFDSCEPLPGMHVNGKLTMGENIADLGGLVLALDAYHASLQGKPARLINGLSGDERFFLSFAKVRRGKQTEQALQAQILTDAHSPDECRVNIAVRNLDAWYAAFDVTPGNRLYLNPANRVSFW